MNDIQIDEPSDLEDQRRKQKEGSGRSLSSRSNFRLSSLLLKRWTYVLVSSEMSKQSDLSQSSSSEDDLVEDSVSGRRKKAATEVRMSSRRGLSGERRGREREKEAAPSDHLDSDGFSRDVVLG